MSFTEMLQEFETFHAKIVEIVLKHDETCETCKNSAICAESVKMFEILEQIEPIHYKYGCTHANYDKI